MIPVSFDEIELYRFYFSPGTESTCFGLFYFTKKDKDIYNHYIIFGNQPNVINNGTMILSEDDFYNEIYPANEMDLGHMHGCINQLFQYNWEDI